jgi:hypothetical protein
VERGARIRLLKSILRIRAIDFTSAMMARPYRLAIERNHRMRRPRSIIGVGLLGLALAGPAPARAGVLMTRDQALAQAFPGARIERRSFVMTDAQLRAVRDAARVKVDSKLVAAHVAWRGDSLLGVAFFESRKVRTMPAVFMTVIAPDSTVRQVDILAFHEPPDFRPPARWLGLFGRRRLDDDLWPRRGIVNLSGATLSTRAVVESVRSSLAIYAQIVAPALPRRVPAVSGRAGPQPR